MRVPFRDPRGAEPAAAARATSTCSSRTGALGEAAPARGRRERARARRASAPAGRARGARGSAAGQPASAGAAHLRPRRPADRRGRVPSRLSRADAAAASPSGLPARSPGPSRAGRRTSRTPRMVYLLSQVEPRRLLPDDDDLRRGAGARAPTPALAAAWVPRLLAGSYDPASRPAARRRARRSAWR